MQWGLADIRRVSSADHANTIQIYIVNVRIEAGTI